jgi:putative ABC transport system permease protein
MTARDLVELASRNLRESLLRSSLTTAGIAVGVASLVAMISLGVGLQELAGKRLSSSGLFDSISISPERTDQRRNGEGRREGSDQESGASRNPGPESGNSQTAEAPDAAGPRVLDDQARREIERLPNVLEVQPEIRFLTEVRYGDRSHVASVGGLGPSARENEAFDGLEGSFFSGPAAREAILRRQFARQLNESSPGSVIGQELVLRYAERQPLPERNREPGIGNRKQAQEAGGSPQKNEDDPYGFSVVRREERLRIVGIIENEPYGGMRASSRAAVFIPTRLAEDLNILQAYDATGAVRARGSMRTYATLMARISDPSKVQGVEDAIRKMGFRTLSILDASQGLRRFFTVLDLFLGIFGSLALVVASLGIINTLVMAVLERRREIGILKAIGASDGDVEKLFFAQAGAMGLVGGILGVLVGRAIGAAINYGTGVYLRRHQLPSETVWSAPLWLVGAAVLFAVLVSLASGLYPARRAARLDPVEALRYE